MLPLQHTTSIGVTSKVQYTTDTRITRKLLISLHYRGRLVLIGPTTDHIMDRVSHILKVRPDCIATKHCA